MRTVICLIIILFVHYTTSAQIGYTVPTAIIVENSEYMAPVYNAEVDIIMREDFGNSRRPIATRIGRYVTDKKGTITVSLMPNKNYTVTTVCKGFYTQISKINTKNFSRTRQNRKGISLRPRNVMAIKGRVITTKTDVVGKVSLYDKTTEHAKVLPLEQDGSFFVKALQGADYELSIVADRLIDTTVILNEVDLQGSTITNPYIIEFEPTAPKPNYRKGDTLRLKNMQFVRRSTRIKELIWLDTLSSILLRNPRVRMKINVHTDSRRSDRLNYILARKRVEEVREELNMRGVSPRQFIFEAKGEDGVLNGCVDGVSCSREEHLVNNRVELIVASGKFLWDPEEEEKKKEVQ